VSKSHVCRQWPRRLVDLFQGRDRTQYFLLARQIQCLTNEDAIEFVLSISRSRYLSLFGVVDTDKHELVAILLMWRDLAAGRGQDRNGICMGGGDDEHVVEIGLPVL
jgi:hypothetical protein